MPENANAPRVEPTPTRCSAMFEGKQCGLRAGHGRDHTSLIPSAEPWFHASEEREPETARRAKEVL